ncbi:anaphase-promoting complex subunit 15-like [Tubulanus polymorphus]|uniref:anaphase-promoting complex subunit 15-like n=1 Tax=Tubulanus polymorphus TaxID=672921 RepID=UPI003DA6149E
MSVPLFPSLLPRIDDPVWFNVDKAYDDDSDLNTLETEHRKMLQSIAEKDNDITPIGKTASEHFDDEEDDEEEDDGDDDESDTNDDDDELDTDMIYDRDSPDDADMDVNDTTGGDSPPWGL